MRALTPFVNMSYNDPDTVALVRSFQFANLNNFTTKILHLYSLDITDKSSRHQARAVVGRLFQPLAPIAIDQRFPEFLLLIADAPPLSEHIAHITKFLSRPTTTGVFEYYQRLSFIIALITPLKSDLDKGDLFTIAAIASRKSVELHFNLKWLT